MGTGAGPYSPFAIRLKKIYRELSARMTETEDEREREFLTKVMTQLETLTTPDYSPIYDALQNIYNNKMGGNAGNIPQPTLDDVVDLELSILWYFEDVAKDQRFAKSTAHVNHRALIYLDAMANVISDQISQSSYHALVDPDVAKSLTGGQHYAIAGYLDVILQAIEDWKKKGAARPTSVKNDLDCFVQYLNAIYSIL